jgi:hypothetical protein
MHFWLGPQVVDCQAPSAGSSPKTARGLVSPTRLTVEARLGTSSLAQTFELQAGKEYVFVVLANPETGMNGLVALDPAKGMKTCSTLFE